MKNRIRELREERGMTQEQLGELVGTSRQAINAIETEKFEPSINKASQYPYLICRNSCSIFGVLKCIKHIVKDLPNSIVNVRYLFTSSK